MVRRGHVKQVLAIGSVADVLGFLGELGGAAAVMASAYNPTHASARLTDPASADSVIQSINALKLFLRSASEIKGKDDGAAN